MALGAAPDRVRAMVLRQVGVMTLIGGAVGLVGAVWARTGAKSHALSDRRASDPLVLAASVVALTLVALGAGFIPAHRASRVDPMLALRVRVGINSQPPTPNAQGKPLEERGGVERASFGQKLLIHSALNVGADAWRVEG